MRSLLKLVWHNDHHVEKDSYVGIFFAEPKLDIVVRDIESLNDSLDTAYALGDLTNSKHTLSLLHEREELLEKHGDVLSGYLIKYMELDPPLPFDHDDSIDYARWRVSATLHDFLKKPKTSG